MSKIICDVCGTSYPETATQCPICGCARHSDVNPVTSENTEADLQSSGNYTFVKGGRFSKSNVKKRNRVIQSEPVPSAEPSSEEQKKGGKLDAVLIATVVILLLAIVAVISYIALRVFFPSVLPGGVQEPDLNLKNPIAHTTSAETTVETTLPKPCTGITLSKTEIEFDKVGAVVLLNATLEPADTTDEVIWASSDEKVVVVTSDGKVEAIGPGQASITVTCGQIVAECRVLCAFEATSESTGATEQTSETTMPVPSSNKLRFTNKYQLPENPDIGDVTIKKGTKWTAYRNAEGLVPSSEVKFTTSKPEVVTINDAGVVTAVGVGEAYITAEYQGQEIKCRILVIS